jgi:diguanylate cyclase (GGDEF)-like protein
LKRTGRIVTALLVFCINSSYIAYYYTKCAYVEIIEFIGLPVMVILAWWFGWQYDKAKFFSEMDVLTEVYNRRAIYKIFPRLKNRHFSILIVDINNFKYINDTFGHRSGDKALKILSKILKEHTYKGSLIARWGGDEFVIITPFTDYNSVERMVNRIQEAIQRELDKYKHCLLKSVGVSIGVAVYPADGKTLDELLHVADKNMYQVKKNKIWDGRKGLYQ